MGTPPDLFTRKETATVLGVTVRTLSNYVTQGLLVPVIEKRKAHFRRGDVLALAEVLRAGNDLAAVTGTALRALVRAEQCERKLNELLGLLGFTTVSLPTTTKGLLELYHRAHRISGWEEPSIIASQVFHFAKELLAFNEEYLRLVEHHTGDAEPWRVFLAACERLARLTPTDRMVYDHELASAYSYIPVARRHLRAVAYFFVRSSHGSEVADKAFIGDNAFDPVITTLFPN